MLLKTQQSERVPLVFFLRFWLFLQNQTLTVSVSTPILNAKNVSSLRALTVSWLNTFFYFMSFPFMGSWAMMGRLCLCLFLVFSCNQASSAGQVAAVISNYPLKLKIV